MRDEVMMGEAARGAECFQAKDDAEREANDENTGEGAVLKAWPGEEEESLHDRAPSGTESERVMLGEGSEETEKRRLGGSGEGAVNGKKRSR